MVTGNRIIGVTITAGRTTTVGMAARIRSIWGQSMETVFHSMVGIIGGTMAPGIIALDQGTEPIARIGGSDLKQMRAIEMNRPGRHIRIKGPVLPFFCFGHPLRHGLCWEPIEFSNFRQEI